MFNLNLINKLINKEVFPDLTTTLCTDSRLFKKNDLFIAISGENFNAVKFIPDLVSKGLTYFIYEKSAENNEQLSSLRKDASLVFAEVKNMESFLAELAKIRIDQWKANGGISIGITGSNGKTTHKEMIYYFLEANYPGQVSYTKGNLNNHLGVPFTILEILDTDKFAIIEMGANHPGEIKFLSSIVNPDFGIITNIGSAHLEFFKNLEGVFKEKSELYFNIMKNKNKFIINDDDDFLKTLDHNNCLSFSSTEKSDLVYELENNSVSLDFLGSNYKFINNNIIGRHNFSNLIASILVTYQATKIDFNKLVDQAARFSMPELNRSNWVDYKNTKIYLDAYNANPSSMNASIDSFIDFLKVNKVDLRNASIILGDMNELGVLAKSEHNALGKKMSEYKNLNTAFVGRYSEYFKDGLGQSELIFKDKKEFITHWEDIVNKSKYIMIKASRSLQLESLLDIK